MESSDLKQKNYAEQAIRLKKALRNEFYVEAIVIEYAMIEDRINSILIHTGHSLCSKNGKPNKLSHKIGQLRSNQYFNQKEIRKRIPLNLLDEIDFWRVSRNSVIHNLMGTDFQPGSIRKLAIQGDNLRRQIDNKSRSIKNYIVKLEKESQ